MNRQTKGIERERQDLLEQARDRRNLRLQAFQEGEVIEKKGEWTTVYKVLLLKNEDASNADDGTQVTQILLNW